MKRNKINRILSFILSLSMISGDVMPALAAGDSDKQPEESIVSADDLADEELPEASGGSQDTDENEKFVYRSGYRAFPGSAVSPSVDSSLSFLETRAALDSDPYNEYALDLATSEASNAKTSDKAFPYAHDGEWLAYFNTNYPATRNQNPYGSCWAHSTMALGEFYLISHGLAGKDIDLSELHLNYWSYNTGTPSAAAGDTGDKVSFTPDEYSPTILDNGGDAELAAYVLMRQRGFADESVAPYTNAKSIADGGKLADDTERKDSYYLKNAYKIDISDPDNRDKVKGAIIENGAVAVSIYADDDCYNETYNSFYDPYKDYTDHAVTVVGWDDDFPASYFNDDPGSNGAWLVRNSWTTNNAASFYSYFWISYEDKALSGGWTYEVSKDFPYDNHYYYDSTINGSVYFKGYFDQFANIFTVNGAGGADSERLDAVTFYLRWMNQSATGYKIEIYKDLKDKNDPTSGTLVGKAGGGSNKLYYLGLYTIALDEPVFLDKGDTFSVVVTFDQPASLGIEKSMSYGGVLAQIGVQKGQSFLGDTEYNYWTDIVDEYGSSGLGNISITALTKDVNDGEDLSKITVEPESIAFDGKGQTRQLDVKVYNKKGVLNKDAKVSYASSDDTVAKVSGTGLITSVGNGNASITVTSDKLSASCNVAVSVEKMATPVADKESGSVLSIGDTVKISCESKDVKIYYTTDGSDPTEKSSLVTDGKVLLASGMPVGELTLKLRAFKDGCDPSDVAEYKYTLESNAGLKLSETEIKLTSGAPTAELKVTVIKDDGTIDDKAAVSWKSDDEKIASVKDGVVTAVGNGKTVIIAQSGSLSANCTVEVELSQIAKPAVSISENAELSIGDVIKVSCEAKDAKIYYTLDGSEPTEASVLSDGQIKIGKEHAGGYYTLKLRAFADHYEASETVSVNFSVKSLARIALSKDKISFTTAGAQIRLSAIVYDATGSVSPNVAVEWKSSDTEVVTVENGMVTSVASGNAVIRATYGSLAAECPVTVDISTEREAAVASNIIVSPESIYFDEDYQSQQLRVTVEDQYGLVIEKPELTFESSDEKVATVNYAGLVRPVASGNAVITVKTGDLSASCEVVVEIEPDEPEVEEIYTVTFKVDGNEYFKAEVSKGSTLEEIPMNPDGDFLCWVDVDTDSVWNTYSCIFKHMTLNARFEEEEVDSAYDTVPDLSQPDLYLVKGQKVQLDSSISWIVDDSSKSYISVSKKGVLTAKKETTDLNGQARVYNAEYDHVYYITITKPQMDKAVSIQVGEQTTLDLGIEDNNKNSRFGRKINYTVAWSSSAPSVATVNGGIVYGIAKGSATITAVVKGKTYKCTVKVTEAKKVKVDKSTLDITLAALQSVNTKVSGEWSADIAMTNVGTASKPVYANSVVSVTKAGKITAIGAGKTVLNAPDGRKINITVNKPVDQIQYIAVGKSKTIKFTSVKNAQASWESSNTSVAAVEKGKVSSKGVGYAVITCTYKLYDVEGAGFTYQTVVYVENPDLRATAGIKKLKANSYELDVDEGSAVALKFTQDDTFAVYQPVVFKSSKPETAFVDEGGLLHAETKGKTKITTKINGKTITITVNVQ